MSGVFALSESEVKGSVSMIGSRCKKITIFRVFKHGKRISLANIESFRGAKKALFFCFLS